MKLSSIVTVCVLTVSLIAGCSKSAQTAGGAAKPGAPAATFTEAQVLEEFGWYLGMKESLSNLGLTKSELDSVYKGFQAAANGKQEPYDLSLIGPRIDEVLGKKEGAHMTALKDKNTTEGAAYFTKLKGNKSVTMLPSGLGFEVVKPGAGPMPGPTDTVRVNYEGKFLDGTVFDSSYKKGQPVEFPLNGVIPGWTEGLQKINKGGKLKLYVPSDLGYGPNGRPGIPPAATLIFELELLEINPPAAMALPAMK